MSVSFGMILFGALLIVAGWQDKSLSALARGDNTVGKGEVLAGAVAQAAPASTSPAASGLGGRLSGAGSAAPTAPTPAGAGGSGGFG